MKENSLFDKISYIFDGILLFDVILCVLAFVFNTNETAQNLLNSVFTWNGFETLFNVTGIIAVVFAGFDILANLICMILDIAHKESSAGSNILSIFNILAGVAFFVVPIFLFANQGTITILESIILSGLVYIGFTLIVGPIENLSFRVLIDNLLDILKIGTLVLALCINEAWYVPLIIVGIEFIFIVIENIVSIARKEFEGSDVVYFILNLIVYAGFVVGVIIGVNKQMPFVELMILALLLFTLVDYALGAIFDTISNIRDVASGDSDE